MLIKEKKLPYMAMVRNLRNLIMAGISDEVVKLAIHYLTNEKAVVKSRMFPYRFFKAYDILDELECVKEKQYHVYDRLAESDSKKVEGLKKKFAALKKKQATMNEKSIPEFKKALDKAVEIATIQNIPPIKGITIILLQLTNRDDNKTMTDILFSLMILRSCENAKLFVANPCVCSKEKYKEVTIKVDESHLLATVKELDDDQKNRENVHRCYHDKGYDDCGGLSLWKFKDSQSKDTVETNDSTFYPIDLIR